MGIDMYPTVESLRQCEYALCSNDLRKVAVLFPPEELKPELASMLSEENGIDGIYLDTLTPGQRQSLSRYNTDDWDYSDAWDMRPDEEQRSICARCPIPPSGYDSCFIRLCGYSAMNSFRTGLAATIAYSKRLSEVDYGDWIDPKDLGDKSPSQKLQECLEKALAKGSTHVSKPEQFFAKVLNSLESKGYEILWGEAGVSSGEPAIEGFLNTYVFRDEPYSGQEAAEFLPYLRILDGLSRKMEYELARQPGGAQLLASIQAFRSILERFIAALNMTVTFNLELELGL